MHAPAKTSRIHALDALRASMMLLGIVLHAAVPFAASVGAAGIGVEDVSRAHPAFDALVGFIHAFRMPAFFAVAGFFGALLLYERGALAMIKNRFLRIGVPLALGTLILWPLSVTGSAFASMAIAGMALEHAFAFALAADKLPLKPAHLWFLWYLLVMSAGAWLVARGTAAVRGGRLPALPSGKRAAAVALILAAATLIFTPRMGETGIPGFAIDWSLMAFYAAFYAFGMLCYGERGILAALGKRWLLLVALGTLLFAFSGKYGAGAALASWVLSAGVIGAFLRFANGERAWVRYLADGAYWIYLVHLPLALFLMGLAYPLPLPAPIAYALVVVMTFLIALLSYRLFVRHTAIGALLNGRRYPR